MSQDYRRGTLSPIGANKTLRVFGDAAVITAIFAIGSILYWSAVWLVAGREGFPLDDAFIHLQFARNLFESGQMAFNAGVPSSGCTAPGFAALISLAHMLTYDWIQASFLVTLVSSLGTSLVVYFALLRWTANADVARWAGVVVALASPTVIQAFSGMEAAVYSFACLMAVFVYGAGGRGMRLLGAFVLSMCIWFRPEFLVGLPILMLEWAHRRSHRREGVETAAWGELLMMIAIWIGMASSYVAFHYQLDGHFVPTTFAAKAVAHFALRPHWLEGIPAIVRHGSWEYLPLALAVLPIVNLLVMGVGVFTICAPLAFGLEESVKRVWRVESSAGAGWRLAVLLLFGYPLARAFVDPAGTLWYQGQRYFAHLTPLFILIVFGAWPMTRSLVAGSRWDWTRRSLNSQCRRAAAWATGASVLMGAVAVFSVKNINDVQVETANWLREHSADHELIAVNDIGAVGFLSDRRILDTVGLIEPEITEHYLNGGDLAAYLARRTPRYVVIFPSWYPAFAAIEDGLSRRAAFTTWPNVVCGGAELVVYEPDWPRIEAFTSRERRFRPSAGDVSIGHAQSLP
ncbi:MAG: hypothetical protein H6818_08135 [Phycisphaerales bacterium]|nr:hypothetical protein [Phycisphaerales bacterium]MCB9862542.1 hypothetical protein [Phycisphaerales bacterium]